MVGGAYHRALLNANRLSLQCQNDGCGCSDFADSRGSNADEWRLRVIGHRFKARYLAPPAVAGHVDVEQAPVRGEDEPRARSQNGAALIGEALKAFGETVLVVAHQTGLGRRFAAGENDAIDVVERRRPKDSSMRDTERIEHGLVGAHRTLQRNDAHGTSVQTR